MRYHQIWNSPNSMTFLTSFFQPVITWVIVSTKMVLYCFSLKIALVTICCYLLAAALLTEGEAWHIGKAVYLQSPMNRLYSFGLLKIDDPNNLCHFKITLTKQLCSCPVSDAIRTSDTLALEATTQPTEPETLIQTEVTKSFGPLPRPNISFNSLKVGKFWITGNKN